MDPDVLLKELRELAKKVRKDYEAGNAIDPDEACELAQKIFDLDEWILKSGFMPREWLDQWVKPMRDDMAKALCGVFDVLYPGGKQNQEWNADTFQQILDALRKEGFEPPKKRKR